MVLFFNLVVRLIRYSIHRVKRMFEAMLKKIIGISLAVLILSGMMGISTWAYFSDFETAPDNVLAAGTLDLKTNDADGISQTLFATNLRPGSEIGPETIFLKNAGSINASSIEFVFSLIEADADRNPVNISAVDTAGQIEVTTLTYNGTDILGNISDSNGNGYKDIDDLAHTSMTGYAGIGAGSVNPFTIGIKLKDSTPGTFQGDGIEITMTFILSQ